MNGKPWTQADTDTLRRMNAVGYRDQQIADYLGFTRETVTRRRIMLGYSTVARDKPKPIDNVNHTSPE